MPSNSKFQIPSDEGPLVAGRARINRSEESSPVQAGTTGVGELRLNASRFSLLWLPSEATDPGLHWLRAICADRSNVLAPILANLQRNVFISNFQQLIYFFEYF